MNTPSASSLSGKARDVYANLRLGLAVLRSELIWMATGVVRKFEVRQLEKRINAEALTLGMADAEAYAASGGTVDAAQRDAILGRISFLRDEIARLEAAHASERQRHVASFKNGAATAADQA